MRIVRNYGKLFWDSSLDGCRKDNRDKAKVKEKVK